MVESLQIEVAYNGFFVYVYYKQGTHPLGETSTRVFCKSTAQINALLKDLFPKPVKQAA